MEANVARVPCRRLLFQEASPPSAESMAIICAQ